MGEIFQRVPHFQPGYRLIDGSDLNGLVDAVNAISTGTLDLGEMVQPDGVTPDDEALAAAFTFAQENGLSIIDGGNTYVLATDFEIDWNGFNLQGVPGKTVFQQTVNGMGFLRILGSYANVAGFTVQFTGTPAYIAGASNFRGFSTWQRMCAVWIEGSHTRIRDVTSIGMRGGFCFRGPVILIGGAPGSNTSLGTQLDARPLAVDNWAYNIQVYSSDVGISGTQQQDGGILQYLCENVTAIQGSVAVPPHAIYMRTIQEGTIYGGICDNFTIGECMCRNNQYAEAFKIRNMINSNFGPLSCNGALGGMQGTLLQNCNVTIGVLQGLLYAGPGAKAVDLAECSNVTVNMGQSICAPGVAMGAFRARDASVDIRVNGGWHIESQPTNAEEIYTVTDTSECTFTDVGHESQGVGKAFMFQQVSTGLMRVKGCKQRSGGNLASVIAGSELIMEFNSAFVDNYSSASISNAGVAYVTDLRSEEGVFTPVITNQAAVASPMTTQTGNYSRRGTLVTASARAQVNGATGFANTDTIQLSGLPYIPAGSTSPAFFAPVQSVGVTPPAGSQLWAEGLTSGPVVAFQTWLSQVRTNLPQSDITAANARFDFEIVYRTAAPWAPVPQCTAIPVITGTVEEGQTLTCSTGTWTNAPTGYAYQWFVGGALMYGFTAPTYVPTVNDVGEMISCQVIATNAQGSVGEWTALTTAVASD